MKRIYASMLLLATCIFALVGCEQSESSDEGRTPLYGYYYLGEESVEVKSIMTADGDQFLLKISPLEDALSATTYAIIGVNTNLLGKTLDVEYRFHNDDYIFVYEDPVRYFSHLRPLQSGEITINRSDAGIVDIAVDVRLYDGTPFRYSAEGLCVTPNN